ncbi:unnamed protein product [Caenorhabditis bovis]|uniref:WD repeat-containing protein 44 n=1 Tax=Caenorhabditis bovis TaxID=2654633 RepID=A0A8S1EKS1_9PELO|nr:unnamed protein product [Caenorhabditis bovis]
MASTSIDDEDDFEDAVDESIAPLNTTPFAFRNSGIISTIQNTPQRPAVLHVDLDWSRTAPVPRAPRQANLGNLTTPRPSSALFQTPGGSSVHHDTSHRDRLVTLRRRMNLEFGNREAISMQSPLDDVDDAVSTMSEAPSLQSWHQHILNRSDTLVVNATDTMSTCAMSVPPSVASDTFEHFKATENETIEHDTQESKQLYDQSCSKSNDSVSSTICDEGQNAKCHKKSNSLDRGLTLAKAIKTGPFPPPANKSITLTSQEADGEEKERNSAAEGVIREITTEFEVNTQENYERSQLETIASLDNSTISNSSASTAHNKKRDIANTVVLEEELEEPCTSRSYANFEECPSEYPLSFKREMHSRSMSNDELKTKNNRNSRSFDPITLDVERRLSMKRNGQSQDDHNSLSLSDDDASRLSVARSSIGQAKNFARNSVRYASGIFRGALKRVRGATAYTGATSSRSEIGEESTEGEDSDEAHHSIANIVRPRKSKKGPFDFENLTVEQELDNEHTGAVWCIKFSVCGRLMATAGQDSILRIWVVRSHLKYFSDMREKYAANMENSSNPLNPMDDIDQFRPPSSMESVVNSESPSDEDSSHLFCAKPFALLKGHTADILDLSWSKNYFILSSGMDRTVKLWHLSRNECLCCFQHIDFVTCVAFLPKDDRYFLSGSLDGKLRLWHIPDKKVAVWNEVQVKFITAITFVKNGKFAVVGTYNGRCYFYTTDQLKYHTVVDVRSTRGKNAKGHKVTGLAVHGDKLLVTSNDSRIRMYDIRDKALTCKFKGVQNDHSQIRAAFSPDGRHIICGSEDKFVYLWRTGEMPSSLSVRKDRNSMWERVRTHNAAVSVAIFAPRPQVFFSMLERREKKQKGESPDFDHQVGHSDSITSNGNITLAGHAIVSADLQGVIKVMINRPKQCKVAPDGFSKSSS